MKINSTLSNRELEYKCRLSKSMDSFGPIENENTSVSEDSIITDMNKNIASSVDSDNSNSSDVDVGDIRNFISDKTFFLVRDSNRDSYSISFDSENQIFEIENDPYNVSKSDVSHSDRHMSDGKYSWNNHINSCIENYIRSKIRIDRDILSDSDKSDDSYFYSYICDEVRNSSESESSSIITSTNDSDSDLTNNDLTDSDLTISDSEKESSDDLNGTQKYKHLWVQCEECYGLNYKKFLKSRLYICEHCGFHLKMSSSDRIELSIDPGTWNPMDEYVFSLDPIEFDSPIELDSPIDLDLTIELGLPIELDSQEEEEEDSYKDRIDYYQRNTGLNEAVQTGTGQLNGIPVAIGVMDFQFMGGSMGCVVGEKITRLIEYATNQFLPLIIVCASGGARMQEGSLSLMQMAKISSALHDYQTNKKLFYISILTSPTTGGVTASFGMLGDIIIAEPDAYIAFAGKRVIEQTLNTTVPEGSQVSESLFDKGLFDFILPRKFLKLTLSELLQLHGFRPLNDIDESK